MWRGDSRSGLSVAAPCVLRCPSSRSSVSTFPSSNRDVQMFSIAGIRPISIHRKLLGSHTQWPTILSLQEEHFSDANLRPGPVRYSHSIFRIGCSSMPLSGATPV